MKVEFDERGYLTVLATDGTTVARVSWREEKEGVVVSFSVTGDLVGPLPSGVGEKVVYTVYRDGGGGR